MVEEKTGMPETANHHHLHTLCPVKPPLSARTHEHQVGLAPPRKIHHQVRSKMVGKISPPRQVKIPIYAELQACSPTARLFRIGAQTSSNTTPNICKT